MLNTAHTQSEHNVFERQSHTANGQQPRSGVWQDNPTTPRDRAASHQPASPQELIRPPLYPKRKDIPRPGRPRKGKTHPTTFHLNPRVKAELERRAQAEGLSVSATGAALLEYAIRQDIQTQQSALLDTIIEKAIAKHMRSYSTRIAVLLVRVAFASEQTRSLATNILSRQPGVTQSVLEDILNGSSNTAKRNITRITPQLADLIAEVEQWLEEGKKPHA